MLDQVIFLEKNKNTLLQKNNYLIAVSGGVDSMVLLHLCKNANLQIQVAHVNYTLRGLESDADASLVENYCTSNNIIFHKKVIDTNAFMQNHKLGLQEAARNIRYAFFDEIIKDSNTQILTAHHANDNIETVLMHIARGTGFNGLSGIPYINKNIIRPLLHFTKQQINDYALQNNIAFRQDASNAKNIYARNAIRNLLIPTWLEINSNFEHSMLQNITVWNQANNVYKKHVAQMLQKLLIAKNGTYGIPIKLLLKQGNIGVWLYEILQQFQFTTSETLEVEKLLFAENGKFISSKTHRIIKDNNFLIISPICNTESKFIIIDNLQTITKFEHGNLQFTQITQPKNLETTNNICYVNSSELQLPLILRSAKTGDYFYPLGLAKKKKISKFFIDNKLTQIQKENVWVLESNKKIVWVIGLRLDDRFKVKANTEQVIKIEFQVQNG